MITIRCTQKLLRRVRSTDEPRPSTTRLGDWYAHILFARPQQLVLCVSERTLLPVVVAASPASELAKRLAAGLAEVLTALGIESQEVAREVRDMSECSFSRTRNRSVLGSLNELAFHLSIYLEQDEPLSLRDASLKLSGVPMSAIGCDSPDRATRSLFARAGPSA